MSDLAHVMERVGRIVAADQQLEVRIQGVLAYSVPGRVVIPAIENYDYLGPDAKRMLHGILDHECGHVSFTDFEKVRWIADNYSPLFKNLWNALEDGMIERLKGEEFRGCQQNLRKIHVWFWNHEGKKAATTRDLMTSFLLAVNDVVTPYGGSPVDVYEDLRPEVYEMLKATEEHWSKVATATTTEEIYQITKAIYEFLEAHDSSEPESEPQSGEGDDSSEATEDSDEAGSDKGESKGQSGETDDGDDETRGAGGESEGDDADEVGGTEGEAEEGEASEDGDRKWQLDMRQYEQPSDVSLNPTEAVVKEIQLVFEDPNGPYTVFSHDFDLVRDFSAETKPHYGYEQESALARRAGRALADAFETGLIAAKDTHFVGGADEGEPDTTLLGEYALGAVPPDQIFREEVEQDADDVAVATLLDCSGSMCGGPSLLARQTAIAMDQALAQCGLAHEITGFTTVRSGSMGLHEWVTSDPKFQDHVARNFDQLRGALIEAEDQGTKIEHFARSVTGPDARNAGLQVPIYGIFKSFGATDARALMNVKGLGENLDGEAVLWQARRLAKRPEKRRVMFVLSDGYPTGANNITVGYRYLKEAIERVHNSGIEVYGIGMKSASVREFYPRSWVCDDLEDLTRVALTAMTEVLLRTRQERTWVNVA